MQYFILFLCCFFSFFIPNESISNEISNLKTHKAGCANALSSALDTFTLPDAFKKVGVSNIHIENGPITPVVYEEQLNTPGKYMRLYYLSYNVSFLLDGQIKNIHLRVGGLSSDEIILLNDTEVLKRLKNVFGHLPGRALSFADTIYIKKNPPIIKNPDDDRVIGGQSGRNESQEDYIIIYFGIFQNHPADRKDLDLKDVMLQGLYHAEMTMPHELGHVIARHTYNNDTATPDQKYQDAILADNTSVSKYGNEKIEEDFAEAMQLYIMTNGGLYYPNVTRRYAHRFEALDKIMGVDPSQRRKIIEINNLFEIQTNDLLRKFGLLTSDFRFQSVPNDVSELFQKTSESPVLEAGFTEGLKDSWRRNYENLRISEMLANKIHALHKERSLDFNSIENRLTRQILEFIRMNKIPEFIINTIYSFGTLSTSEMTRRLHTLERALEVISDKPDRYEDINFEQILETVRP